jgi:hypothetical protein
MVKLKTFRFGKHAPKHDYRTLRLKDYISKLAPPPETYDVLASDVYPNLGISDPTQLFPIDGNDVYGDCTIAGISHAITVYRGMISQNVIPSSDDIVKLYFHLTDGQDTGLNELDVLNYWRQNSFEGDEIIAYAKIDVTKHDQVMQAISLFGGIYLGFQVQVNAIDDFNNGNPWTPGDLTNDGHAVYATAYDQNYVTVLTWGNTQLGTWGWWDECVDEAYAIISPEAADPKFAPGFDLDQLLEDLQDIAQGGLQEKRETIRENPEMIVRGKVAKNRIK